MDGKRDDIQGLRALAVLAVIVFHVNHNWLPGGFVGVDIFFVVSGYLITGIVTRQKAMGTFNVVDFYKSRVRRIVPAYLCLLAMVAIVMAALLTPRDFHSFFASLKSALYFNSNNYFNGENDYFAAASYELPLLHTWSLAVEMQFYLVLPALVILIPKRLIKPALTLTTVLLMLYAEYRLFNNEKQGVYFSLLARAPEFLVGGLLAVSATSLVSDYRAIKAWTGVGLLVLSFVFISEDSAFPGFLALAPCVGTALLLSARGSLINRWLASRAMVFVGGLSYSLYLWHWPILASMRYFSESYILPLNALAAFAVLTVALSLCSYYLIEKPLRAIKGRHGNYKMAALTTGVVIVILAAKAANPLIVPALPVELTQYAPAEAICHGQIVEECLRGNPEGSTEILLLGDSHAAQLNYFADVVGKAINARIRVISASSCVPIAGFDKERIPERSRKACDDQTLAIEQHLDSADVIWLAGMWQYHAPSEAFMTALERFLSDTEKRSQPLVVFAQVPMLTSNMQRMYRFNELGSSRTAHLESTWAGANQHVKEQVTQHRNAVFFDPELLALFSTPPIAEGRLIYYDNHHLNEVGSIAYGTIAAEFMRTEMKRLQRLTSELKASVEK